MTQQTPDLVGFTEPKVELINELDHIMLEKRISPQKLFIVGKHHYLLVYQNMISSGTSQEEFGIITNRHLDRGDILDSFSKIELILNEIIEAKILGEQNQKSSEFSGILDRIDFAQKIHLLNEWNLISPETFELLHKLRWVRNVLAHSWHIKHAIYGRDQTLETNFKQFQEDLKKVWERLINVYDFLRPQNRELEKVLNQLKQILEKNGTTNTDKTA